MTQRQCLILMLTLSVEMLLPSLCHARVDGSKEQPNIVFFFVDDMGWQDTSEPVHRQITQRNQPPYSSVRQGNWKLIYQHVDRRLELYHLTQDIGETTNLASTRPDKLKELVDTLTTHLRPTRAPMPIDKATGNPIACQSGTYGPG